MTAVLDFFAHPVMDTIGLALLHFLWQGALVGLVVLIALFMIPRANAPLRYNVCVGAMLLLLLLPLGTAVQIHFSHRHVAEPFVAQPNTELYQKMPIEEEAATVTDEHPVNAVPVEAPTVAVAPQVEQSVPAKISNDVFRWRHALAVLWLFGLVFSSLRMLDGLITIWRLKRNAQPIEDAALVQLFATVHAQLELKKPVAFRSTNQVIQPLIVGWLKPMVIVPAGMLTGMAPAHIEAVLAHELIHVRRHDYLVLWLQSLLETLFFFHPVVWWISGRLRIEREYCTDADTVAATDDKLTYVRALTILEEQKIAWRMSLSMQDGKLVDRIRRLTGSSEKRSRWQGSWSTLAAVMIGCVMLFLACEAAYVDESKPADELFQEANELARKGHYGRAARVAEVAADKGDLCALELITQLYHPAKIPRVIDTRLALDPVKWSGESEEIAWSWMNRLYVGIKQAAEEGNTDAMMRLSWMLLEDIDTGEEEHWPKDDSLAHYWMKRAADLGHPHALFIYGFSWTPKDSTEKRLEYVRKSALAGREESYSLWAGLVSHYDDPRPYFEVASLAIAKQTKGLYRWIGRDLAALEENVEKGDPIAMEWMAVADSLGLRERLAQIPKESNKRAVYPEMPFCPGTVHWRFPLGLE